MIEKTLTDRFGRSFPYLRLSITDVCNFKCTYCLPDGYKGEADGFLGVDEIRRLIECFAELGTRKVRLTGGEPTLRKDFLDIARVVSQTPGIQTVAMTTNGYKLPEDEDPRISRLGRFLRKTSLDELPQLWNVVRGEMSIVGPRPIVPAELENYAPYADLFLTTRPGLTGRWQGSGRSDIQYPERAFMDLDYVGLNSLLSDISIMLRTVPSVLLRRGAH